MSYSDVLLFDPGVSQWRCGRAEEEGPDVILPGIPDGDFEAWQAQVLQQGQRDPLAVPALGCCASSGRAWRLWPARHSQEEVGPLGAQPLPRALEPAASKAAEVTTAFDHTGARGNRGAGGGPNGVRDDHERAAGHY